MKYLHKKRRHKTMTTSLSATRILRIYEGSLKGLPVARKSKVAEFARFRIQYDRGGKNYEIEMIPRTVPEDFNKSGKRVGNRYR